MQISRRVLLAAALSLGALQAQAAVAPQALVAPITDYKLYVLDNLEQFTEHTRAFTEAVKAGDLARAQALYALAAFITSALSPLPSCLPIWMRASTPVKTITSTAYRTRPLPVFTVWSTACSMSAAPTAWMRMPIA